MGNTSSSVRLTPELQAAYQQIYNDPTQKGSQAWTLAARGLAAAGVIEASGADGEPKSAMGISESRSVQRRHFNDTGLNGHRPQG